MRTAVLLAGALLTACGSGLDDVTQFWGGPGLGVETTPTSSRFGMACASATLGPLRLDSEGRFVVTGIDSVFEGPETDTLPGPKLRQIRIAGMITGDRMSVDVSYPPSTVAAEHYLAIRGQSTEFNGYACPL